jgi:hypothetical protein
MANITAIGKPVTAVSGAAARLSLWAAIAFLVLLAALHFIKPKLDPSWHFISEYAIGDYGWIMALAFLALALSYGALFIAISHNGIIGGIGLALLLVAPPVWLWPPFLRPIPLTPARER